jgi:hypothetical protein
VCSRDAVETVKVCCEAEEVLMILARWVQPRKSRPTIDCGVQNATLDYQINEIKHISGTIEKGKAVLKLEIQKVESTVISWNQSSPRRQRCASSSTRRSRR